MEDKENVSAYCQVTRDRLNHLTEEFRRYQKTMNGNLEKLYGRIDDVYNKIQNIEQSISDTVNEEVDEKIEQKDNISKPEKILIAIFGAFFGGVLTYIFTNIVSAL